MGNMLFCHNMKSYAVSFDRGRMAIVTTTASCLILLHTKKIPVIVDGWAWQKRGSGRLFDSLTGSTKSMEPDTVAEMVGCVKQQRIQMKEKISDDDTMSSNIRNPCNPCKFKEIL